jgi:hypothetical protein
LRATLEGVHDPTERQLRVDRDIALQI